MTALSILEHYKLRIAHTFQLGFEIVGALVGALIFLKTYQRRPFIPTIIQPKLSNFKIFISGMASTGSWVFDTTPRLFLGYLAYRITGGIGYVTVTKRIENYNQENIEHQMNPTQDL